MKSSVSIARGHGDIFEVADEYPSAAFSICTGKFGVASRREI